MCSPLSRLARIRRAELRPIARWAIRAFVALLSPCGGGQYALQPGYVLAAVAACAHTPCRIAPYCPLGNTGFCRRIARWAIRAIIALQGNAIIATPNVESTARFRSIHAFDRRHRSHRQCRRLAHRVADSSNDR